MRAFPLVRDLVTDVSWNYEVNKTIEPFTPPDDVPQDDWRWQQQDIERVQEYRKCIECFLCQDVCHVLRNHETDKPFMGPRYLVRSAGLEMHPWIRPTAAATSRTAAGSAIATSPSAAPRSARSTSRSPTTRSSRSRNAFADEFYDPIQWFLRKIRGSDVDAGPHIELPVLQGGAPGPSEPSADGGPSDPADDRVPG
jgi:succinate dehydrogenase / fumarate reductase iron-sulfur subunit